LVQKRCDSDIEVVALAHDVGDAGPVRIDVALAVADELRLPLRVLLVRPLYLDTPAHYVLGAVTAGEIFTTWETMGRSDSVASHRLRAHVYAQFRAVLTRQRRFDLAEGERTLAGREVILVGDGASSGSMIRVAMLDLRKRMTSRILVALPTASPEAFSAFEDLADETLCPDVSRMHAWSARESSRFRSRSHSSYADIELARIIANHNHGLDDIEHRTTARTHPN
jgi:predicted phosphoribosyltransferase